MRENSIHKERTTEAQIRARIPSLTFADDFVFFTVLTGNEEICKEVIEACIGKPIGRIVYTNGQEAMKLMLEGKGIRLDVYAKDSDHVLYDIEMQVVKDKFFGRRSGYYDSVMTLNTLKSGDAYGSLAESYVIFICAFDPFSEKRAVYRFCNREEKNRDLLLDDGAHKILLNAYGNTEGCTESLKQLLAAVRGETVSDDGLDRGLPGL